AGRPALFLVPPDMEKGSRTSSLCKSVLSAAARMSAKRQPAQFDGMRIFVRFGRLQRRIDVLDVTCRDIDDALGELVGSRGRRKCVPAMPNGMVSPGGSR